jgi:hypothetical protein
MALGSPPRSGTLTEASADVDPAMTTSLDPPTQVDQKLDPGASDHLWSPPERFGVDGSGDRIELDAIAVQPGRHVGAPQQPREPGNRPTTRRQVMARHGRGTNPYAAVGPASDGRSRWQRWRRRPVDTGVLIDDTERYAENLRRRRAALHDGLVQAERDLERLIEERQAAAAAAERAHRSAADDAVRADGHARALASHAETAVLAAEAQAESAQQASRRAVKSAAQKRAALDRALAEADKADRAYRRVVDERRQLRGDAEQLAALARVQQAEADDLARRADADNTGREGVALRARAAAMTAHAAAARQRSDDHIAAADALESQVAAHAAAAKAAKGTASSVSTGDAALTDILRARFAEERAASARDRLARLQAARDAAVDTARRAAADAALLAATADRAAEEVLLSRNALEQAREEHARLRENLSGDEVSGSEGWHEVNTDVGPTVGEIPPEVPDPAPITGGTRPYGRPGGYRRPLAAHQRLLERAVPRGADGRPLVDPRPEEEWVELINARWAVDDPARRLNPWSSIEALFHTLDGRPRVALPRTFDGYANGDVDTPIGGEEGGAARVEAMLGGHLQSLADFGDHQDLLTARMAVQHAFEVLRDQLLAAGHGSRAVVVTTDAGGTTRVTAAVNYDDTIVHIDPHGGRVSDDLPLEGPLTVRTMDALVVSVVDGDYHWEPFLDAPPGRSSDSAPPVNPLGRHAAPRRRQAGWPRPRASATAGPVTVRATYAEELSRLTGRLPSLARQVAATAISDNGTGSYRVEPIRGDPFDLEVTVAPLPTGEATYAWDGIRNRLVVTIGSHLTPLQAERALIERTTALVALTDPDVSATDQLRPGARHGSVELSSLSATDRSQLAELAAMARQHAEARGWAGRRARREIKRDARPLVAELGLSPGARGAQERSAAVPDQQVRDFVQRHAKDARAVREAERQRRVLDDLPRQFNATLPGLRSRLPVVDIVADPDRAAVLRVALPGNQQITVRFEVDEVASGHHLGPGADTDYLVRLDDTLGEKEIERALAYQLAYAVAERVADPTDSFDPGDHGTIAELRTLIDRPKSRARNRDLHAFSRDRLGVTEGVPGRQRRLAMLPSDVVAAIDPHLSDRKQLARNDRIRAAVPTAAVAAFDVRRVAPNPDGTFTITVTGGRTFTLDVAGLPLADGHAGSIRGGSSDHTIVVSDTVTDATVVRALAHEIGLIAAQIADPASAHRPDALNATVGSEQDAESAPSAAALSARDRARVSELRALAHQYVNSPRIERLAGWRARRAQRAAVADALTALGLSTASPGASERFALLGQSITSRDRAASRLPSLEQVSTDLAGMTRRRETAVASMAATARNGGLPSSTPARRALVRLSYAGAAGTTAVGVAFALATGASIVPIVAAFALGSWARGRANHRLSKLQSPASNELILHTVALADQDAAEHHANAYGPALREAVLAPLHEVVELQHRQYELAGSIARALSAGTTAASSGSSLASSQSADPIQVVRPQDDLNGRAVGIDRPLADGARGVKPSLRWDGPPGHPHWRSVLLPTSVPALAQASTIFFSQLAIGVGVGVAAAAAAPALALGFTAIAATLYMAPKHAEAGRLQQIYDLARINEIEARSLAELDADLRSRALDAFSTIRQRQQEQVVLLQAVMERISDGARPPAGPTAPEPLSDHWPSTRFFADPEPTSRRPPGVPSWAPYQVSSAISLVGAAAAGAAVAALTGNPAVAAVQLATGLATPAVAYGSRTADLRANQLAQTRKSFGDQIRIKDQRAVIDELGSRLLAELTPLQEVMLAAEDLATDAIHALAGQAGVDVAAVVATTADQAGWSSSGEVGRPGFGPRTDFDSVYVAADQRPASYLDLVRRLILLGVLPAAITLPATVATGRWAADGLLAANSALSPDRIELSALQTATRASVDHLWSRGLIGHADALVRAPRADFKADVVADVQFEGARAARYDALIHQIAVTATSELVDIGQNEMRQPAEIQALIGRAAELVGNGSSGSHPDAPAALRTAGPDTTTYVSPDAAGPDTTTYVSPDAAPAPVTGPAASISTADIIQLGVIRTYLSNAAGGGTADAEAARTGLAQVEGWVEQVEQVIAAAGTASIATPDPLTVAAGSPLPSNVAPEYQGTIDNTIATLARIRDQILAPTTTPTDRATLAAAHETIRAVLVEVGSALMLNTPHPAPRTWAMVLLVDHLLTNTEIGVALRRAEAGTPPDRRPADPGRTAPPANTDATTRPDPAPDPPSAGFNPPDVDRVLSAAREAITNTRHGLTRADFDPDVRDATEAALTEVERITADIEQAVRDNEPPAVHDGLRQLAEVIRDALTPPDATGTAGNGTGADNGPGNGRRTRESSVSTWRPSGLHRAYVLPNLYWWRHYWSHVVAAFAILAAIIETRPGGNGGETAPSTEHEPNGAFTPSIGAASWPGERPQVRSGPI